MTPELAGSQVVIELLYLIASVLFILSLKWMSSPTTARHGIWAGEVGMLLAISGTLLHHGIVRLPPDRHCARARHDHRRAARARGDDGGSAANRAQSRLWRALRHAGRLGRVLSALARHLALHDVGAVARGHSRRVDRYRQLDGRRQVAGNSAAAAADLQRPEPRQLSAARLRCRDRRNSGAASGSASHCFHSWF